VDNYSGPRSILVLLFFILDAFMLCTVIYVPMPQTLRNKC